MNIISLASVSPRGVIIYVHKEDCIVVVTAGRYKQHKCIKNEVIKFKIFGGMMKYIDIDIDIGTHTHIYM